MAKGEIVKFLTQDNLELQGFFVGSKSDIGILHIPGINGNFYEDSFLDFMSDFAEKKKVNFLSMNTRGHDYVNELDKKVGTEYKTVYIGGALERFEDCIHDIKAGIDLLKKKGCKKIILQGHSSGCQKIAYYQLKTEDKDVCGLILLAPADDMTLVRDMLGKDFGETVKRIENVIKTGKGDEFLPKGTVTLPIISAERLYSLCRPSNIEARLFNYSGEMKELGRITLPILAVFGSNDIYLTMPAEKTLAIIKERAGKSKRCDTAVIEGSPHNFRGYERKLVEIIDKWVETLCKKK